MVSGAWLGLNRVPYSVDAALEARPRGKQHDDRRQAEQGDTEVQDQVPGAELGLAREAATTSPFIWGPSEMLR